MALRRGVWIIIVLMVIASAISMTAVVGTYLMLSAEPSVPQGTTLVLRIGELPEGDGREAVRGFFGAPGVLTLPEVIDSLKRAKSDPRVTGVLIVPNGVPQDYWARIQEVRDAIIDFRTSRKPAFAYVEYGGEREYYLATACDRIFLMPTSPLDLTGLASYEVFLRGTLDKIGAYPDIHHIGEYKTAANQLTETTFTPAHREMTESLNRDLFGQLVGDIAKSRGKTEADVRALVDEGPFLAEAARSAGLVDELAYEDQIDDFVDGAKGEMNLLDGFGYARARGSRVGLRSGPRVGVISVAGTIASGRGGFDPLYGGIAGSDLIVEQIRRARSDSSLRAIIVRIDSPGGSTIASDVIWRELAITRRQQPDRPIVVSMSNLAASGGYYIAMPAHAIVALPGTLTGSIGIYGGKVTTGGTYQKLGMTFEAVSSGRHAEMNSPVRPYTESERGKLQEQLRAFYTQFVQKVADARGMSTDKVDSVAQGRVWTGKQAKEIGLVDELGGFETAIKVAKRRAKIAESAEVELVSYPSYRGLFDLLSQQLGQAAHERLMTLAPDVVRLMAPLAMPFDLFRRGEVLALAPLG
ncbi:MAG: signal peptide peptidase SppA, partial [Acidobacteria bacterium]